MRINRWMLRQLGIQVAWLLCAVGVIGVFLSAFDRDGMRYVPRAYREAVARAADDTSVQDALGAPVEAIWWRELDLDLRGTKQHLRMKVQLSGSRRDGLLRIEAHRQSGRWRFDRLVVEPDGAPRSIDLL